jgi:hypothetical protein
MLQKNPGRAAWPALICLLAVAAVGLAADAPAPIATYRLEIRIDAPPLFVYPYLVEEDKVARWNQDKSVTVTFPRGIEPRIGKQIRVAVDAPTHPWILMEIVRLDPGREALTRFVDGVLEGEFAYLLSPDGPHGTLFVHEMRIRPKGAFMTFLWEVLGKHLHRAKMRAFMGKIKEVVEADYRKQ